MRYRRILITLCLILLSVSSGYAQQFRPALPSEFTNSSPERFFEARNSTVRSFTNPQTFSCYAHVIKSSSGNILIDPGYYDGDLRDYIKSIGGIDTVLLSHCHVDHIIGLDSLMKDYPDAKIYIHNLDRDGLYDVNVNYSFERRISEPFVIEADVLPLEAGGYTFSGQKVQVIHSPGHSPGSALYYFADEGLLFLGDTIAFWGLPSYGLLNSSVPALFESLTRLKTLGLPSDTQVFFGHGERITYGEMLKNFDCFTKTLALGVKDSAGNVSELKDYYLDGDTLMLSLKEIAEVLNTAYFFSPDSQSAVFFLPDMSRLQVKAGNSEAELESFAVNMNSPAKLKDGKIYLPGKFTAQILKSSSAWNLYLR